MSPFIVVLVVRNIAPKIDDETHGRTRLTAGREMTSISALLQRVLVGIGEVDRRHAGLLEALDRVLQWRMAEVSPLRERLARWAGRRSLAWVYVANLFR